MNKRTIAIFTGNRAEYGLQYPILKAVSEDDSLEYKLLVSGAHLDSNFGATLDEIKKDGFEITEEIKIDLSVDSHISTAMAISSGVSEISRCLAEIKPDLFVVYADRFEGFAAVIASTQMAIPTAHIEGGDVMPWDKYIFVGTYRGEDYADYITARTNMAAVRCLQDLFPTKEIVMIETSNINYGGGSIHCITMNVPKI